MEKENICITDGIKNAGRVFQRLGGWGHDDSVPVEVTETTPSGDKTT